LKNSSDHITVILAGKLLHNSLPLYRWSVIVRRECRWEVWLCEDLIARLDQFTAQC